MSTSRSYMPVSHPKASVAQTFIDRFRESALIAVKRKGTCDARVHDVHVLFLKADWNSTAAGGALDPGSRPAAAAAPGDAPAMTFASFPPPLLANNLSRGEAEIGGAPPICDAPSVGREKDHLSSRDPGSREKTSPLRSLEMHCFISRDCWRERNASARLARLPPREPDSAALYRQRD